MSESLWFATSRKNYDVNYARFYDASLFPWAKAIEERWSEIKEELQQFIAENDAQFKSNLARNYKDIDATGWSSLASLFWGLKVSDSIGKKCPLLFGLLEKVPGLSSASFSRLEPHVRLGEHHGETNGIVRCHLGIEIPDAYPLCGINVAGEERGWEEGKWLFFNDAQNHSAWNDSDKRRILFIIDVIRPEFISRKNYIMAKVLAYHFFTQHKILHKLPRSLKLFIFYTSIVAFYVIRPVYNALGLNKLYHE